MHDQMIGKIEWTSDNYVTVGDYKIPSAKDLVDGYKQGSGIKQNSRTVIYLKRLLWPLFKTRRDLLIDGFIEREIGKLIRQYITNNETFFEIGCGDMSLGRFLPENMYYNALDLELSEFHIRRILRTNNNANIILASATEIPANSNVASLIISTETFEHIPEIDKAINEIHRIAQPNAKIICSIPNNYCYKYKKKGAHSGHINNWTYDGFIQYMKLHDFDLLNGFMKGLWIPLPLWLTRTSYQLPVSHKLEYYNTNFFYVFKVNK